VKRGEGGGSGGGEKEGGRQLQRRVRHHRQTTVVESVISTDQTRKDRKQYERAWPKQMNSLRVHSLSTHRQ
jgi:hypothetical protein